MNTFAFRVLVTQVLGFLVRGFYCLSSYGMALGFRVLRVWGLGCRIEGVGCRI